MIAWSFGRRASNSSATRGRPPVMSRVLAQSSGIRAMHVTRLDLLPGLDRQNGLDREQITGIAATRTLIGLPFLSLITIAGLARNHAASHANR